LLPWGDRSYLTRIPHEGGEVLRRTIAGDPGAGNTREVAEYNMAYAQFLRHMDGPTPPRITRVDVYESPGPAARFARERARMAAAGAPSDETWVFHGTARPETAERIMLEGFRVGGTPGVPVANGAVHGSGVYAARGPAIPAAYAAGAGQVVLARALSGRRTLRAEEGGDSWEPTEDWMVIRRAEQLLPVYLIHFHFPPAPAGSGGTGGCAVM
jgi:hypothetical protein